MTRYLNQDIVRREKDGPIHVYGFANAMVEGSLIDFEDRITIVKDNVLGKLKIVKYPNKGERFISFPIVTDFYSSTAIKNQVVYLCEKYNIYPSSIFDIFPYACCKSIEESGIPLSQLSERIVNIFGEGEVMEKERLNIVEIDITGIEYAAYHLTCDKKLMKKQLVYDGEILSDKYDKNLENIRELENEIKELENRIHNLKNEREYAFIDYKINIYSSLTIAEQPKIDEDMPIENKIRIINDEKLNSIEEQLTSSINDLIDKKIRLEELLSYTQING